MFVYQKKINNYSALILQNTRAMYPVDGAAVVAIYTNEDGDFTYAVGSFENGEFVYGDQPVSLPEVTIDDNGKVLTVVDGEWAVAEPISGISFRIVDELPAEGDSSVVYLVPISGTEADVYAEYIYIDGNYEKFGTTTVPGTIVVANPTLAGTEAALTGLEVDGTKYKAVGSVAGKSGEVTLNKGDVGLGNVDNTSDANKPVSTATQAALDAKQGTLVSGVNIKTLNNESILGSGNLSVSGFNPSDYAGYDATKTQTLTQVQGTLTWNGDVVSYTVDGSTVIFN